MPTIEINWIYPYELLIKENGLEFCLEYVPGTRNYLTHTKTYGRKENENA